MYALLSSCNFALCQPNDVYTSRLYIQVMTNGRY